MANRTPVHPITEALRTRRLHRKLTQNAVSDIAKISRGSLHHWEDCKFSGLANLDRWAKALGFQVTLIDLTLNDDELRLKDHRRKEHALEHSFG